MPNLCPRFNEELVVVGLEMEYAFGRVQGARVMGRPASEGSLLQGPPQEKVHRNSAGDSLMMSYRVSQ